MYVLLVIADADHTPALSESLMRRGWHRAGPGLSAYTKRFDTADPGLAMRSGHDELEGAADASGTRVHAAACIASPEPAAVRLRAGS